MNRVLLLREDAFGFGNLPVLYLFFEESINVCHGNLGIDRIEPFIICIEGQQSEQLVLDHGGYVRCVVGCLGCCDDVVQGLAMLAEPHQIEIVALLERLRSSALFIANRCGMSINPKRQPFTAWIPWAWRCPAGSAKHCTLTPLSA